MKYGSIYSKDNIENKYNYSSTGGRRSSQNNFETSHDHHTHSTLNTPEAPSCLIEGGN